MSAVFKSCFIIYCLLSSLPVLANNIEIVNMYCENRINPVGLDEKRPVFTWKFKGNKRGLMQAAYSIRVGIDSVGLMSRKAIVWESGKIMSDQSVHVPYSGLELKATEKYFWQVKIWDNYGRSSSWSMVAFWQMGLMKRENWKAKWIESDVADEFEKETSPLFRKEFVVSKKVKSATAFITSLGLYEAYINGSRVGNDFFTPGWTSYAKRLQYQVYDVSSLVQSGSNAIGVVLGKGWYKSPLGWGATFNNEIKQRKLALLFQLQVKYTDGTSETVISDENWKFSFGSILCSEIYAGEIINASLEPIGWKLPGFKTDRWYNAKAVVRGNRILTSTNSEPVRCHEIFSPKSISKTPGGDWIVDFGQNMAGYVKLKVSGRAGDTIIIDHAEVLDKSGEFYTKNLRKAKARSMYILSGRGEEVFDAHFTFYGFRYVSVKGFPGVPSFDNFTAVSLYSDMDTTGYFSCSNPLVNQLQHNIQWGQKSNFLEVPTDCPQRDERLGWTGDAQVFAATAAFNMQVYNFFAKWLKDLALDQFEDGVVPFVIPHVLDSTSSGSTGWADASTIIPWQMYLSYGNKKILEDQYLSMKAWVECMRKGSRDYIWRPSGLQIGDWLFYRPDDDYDGTSALTSKYFIAQCFFAHSTQLLINAAGVLGKEADVNYYSVLLTNIKESFVKEYLTPNGNLVSGTQTAYVLALNFDMLPDRYVDIVLQKLVENIKAYNNHLTTGFIGTPYICAVLSRYGKHDLAYSLLLQETYPSWLYPVKMGATTIWERWDGIRTDSSFQNPDMNSFNHYAYGAVGNWMYTAIAGINTDSVLVGYKKIIVKPHLGGGLTFAEGTLQTYYGRIQSGWKVYDDRLIMDIEIPANTNAIVYIPAKAVSSVEINNKKIIFDKSIKNISQYGEYVIVEVGSGKYNFVVSK